MRGAMSDGESEAFWPDIQAEGQACGGGPPHRYRSLDLQGACVVAQTSVLKARTKKQASTEVAAS